MGSAVLGLIHIDTATLGVPDSIWPSARVRFSVRTHGLDCPWVRGLVCSARRGAMAKVTEACDLTRKLAHDDRAKDGPGFTVSRACRPFPPVRRRSGAYRLRADGRSRGRGRHITGAKSKPCGRRSAALPPSAARWRKPGSPPSGETVRVGVAGPLLAAPSFRLPMAWRAAARHRSSGPRGRS